jgi:hypothetical protein
LKKLMIAVYVAYVLIGYSLSPPSCLLFSILASALHYIMRI